MNAILDFTKSSTVIRNCENCKIRFARVVKYDAVKHFPAFGSVLYLFLPAKRCKSAFFIKKWLDLNHLMLLIKSYLVTIATDGRQTSLKCVRGLKAKTSSVIPS